MKVTLWGTRGSLATPGPETARYGGNTACVAVTGRDGNLLVLDAGTGIRRLGAGLNGSFHRIDILLTHLHMDHIQGLGFFAPLFEPDMEVHVYGPASTTLHLRERLVRYLSPPLFPVHLRDVPSKLYLHEVPCGPIDVGGFVVETSLVCHPNPTVGYRVTENGASLAYLPDHEPALGLRQDFLTGEWTSGYQLARGADLLIHDAQYTDDEYYSHVGWGHSSFGQALDFARLAGVKRLVPFHHDPGHDDARMDELIDRAAHAAAPGFTVSPGVEGTTFNVE